MRIVFNVMGRYLRWLHPRVGSRGRMPGLCQQHRNGGNPIANVIYKGIHGCSRPFSRSSQLLQEFPLLHTGFEGPAYEVEAIGMSIKERVQRSLVDGKYQYVVQNAVANAETLLAAYDNIKARLSGWPSDLPESQSKPGLVASCHIQNPEAEPDGHLEIEGLDKQWFQDLAQELGRGTFSVRNNCQLFTYSESKISKSMSVPNLRLKIVKEAVRMVLEQIYEPQFRNFSCGFRPQKGRHVALKDIKSRWTPTSWWICFEIRKDFDIDNLDILHLTLEENIQDELLLQLLHEMFQTGTLQLDIGKLSRGFYHEDILSPMLVNIYFHKLDQEIDRLIKKVFMLNPKSVLDQHAPGKFDIEAGTEDGEYQNCEGNPTDSPSMTVKRKRGDRHSQPVAFKLYACRYADEVLLGLVGSKELAACIKHEITTFLWSNMSIEVERSFLRERASGVAWFLGIKLQFVPPSKVPGYMSPKAITALRKVQHRIRAHAIQRKIHEEADLRKLGGKLLQRIFKKAKDEELSNLERNEKVSSMLKGIAKDVVEEFLNTQEERDTRTLMYGKFYRSERLLTPWVRKKLPQDLVEAYDRFQEKLKAYLVDQSGDEVPNISEVSCEDDGEDETAITVTPLPDVPVSFKDGSGIQKGDGLRLLLYGSIEDIRHLLFLCGFINRRGQSQAIEALIPLEDVAICQWYGAVALGFLNYFRCCDNFMHVKRMVDYHVRRSCLYTLAAKHEANVHKFKAFKNAIKASGLDETMSRFFPTEHQLQCTGKAFLTDPKPVDDVIFTLITNAPNGTACTQKCLAIGCSRYEVEIYLVRIARLREKDKFLIGKSCGFREPPRGFHLKKLPLCREHYLGLSSGRLPLRSLRLELLDNSQEEEEEHYFSWTGSQGHIIRPYEATRL